MNIKPADRLKHFPVYLFDALDQQKVEQEAKGVDVIDLSVGDRRAIQVAFGNA